MRSVERHPQEQRFVAVVRLEVLDGFSADPRVGVPLFRPREAENVLVFLIVDGLLVRLAEARLAQFDPVVVVEPRTDEFPVLEDEVVDAEALVVLAVPVVGLDLSGRALYEGNRCIVALPDVGRPVSGVL